MSALHITTRVFKSARYHILYPYVLDSLLASLLDSNPNPNHSYYVGHVNPRREFFSRKTTFWGTTTVASIIFTNHDYTVCPVFSVRQMQESLVTSAIWLAKVAIKIVQCLWMLLFLIFLYNIIIIIIIMSFIERNITAFLCALQFFPG